MSEIEKLKKANEETNQRLDELMEMMTALIKEKSAEETSEGRNVGKETPIHAPSFESMGSTSQGVGGNTVNVAIPPMVAPSHPTQHPIGENTYSTMSMPAPAFGPSPAFVPTPTFVPPPIPNAIPLFNRGHDATNPVVLDDEKKDDSMQSIKMFSLLDERLKLIEGFSYHRAMNASEATLVPGLVIPHKFKVPEFEKYNGTKCPQDHLLSYVRKMAAHTYDDKLMIHFFQDSLTGAASRWYN